jgi:hypothetical protein
MSETTSETMDTDGSETVGARARALAERAREVEPVDEKIALGVAGGGVLAMLASWPLRSRLLGTLGALAALAGGGLYAQSRLAERSERIDEAEAQVHSALEGLDPVARAQVLADLAG